MSSQAFRATCISAAVSCTSMQSVATASFRVFQSCSMGLRLAEIAKRRPRETSSVVDCVERRWFSRGKHTPRFLDHLVALDRVCVGSRSVFSHFVSKKGLSIYLFKKGIRAHFGKRSVLLVEESVTEFVFAFPLLLGRRARASGARGVQGWRGRKANRYPREAYILALQT